MKLIGVKPENLDAAWPHIEPWIKAACKSGKGRFDEFDVYNYVKEKEWQLWLMVGDSIKAVCTTEIINYSKLKVCRVCMLTGKDYRSWHHLREHLEKWAKEEGCKRIEALARKGWLRVFRDYEETHRFIEKEL